MISGWLTNSFRSTCKNNTGYNACSYIFMQTRDYAARKGTREKAKKKKVKVTVEKVGFIPPRKGDKVKKLAHSPLLNINDSWKKKADDDVWIVKYHQSPVYHLREVIEFHRETHHPTMLNKPNAPIVACIELNMRREKKTRFVEKFTKVIDTPYTFVNENVQNKVLALSKNLGQQEKAKNAGADFVGGVELVKQIQNGTFVFKEYDHIVAHADILTELLLIRGLLKKKFPNVKAGTLSIDVGKLVTKFKHGIHYTAIPHADHKDYGRIDTTFGLLDMDTKQLEKNFSVLINDVEKVKPRPGEFFIQRVKISSAPSNEAFTVDFKEFLPVSAEEGEEQEEAGDNIAIISTV